MDQPAAAHAPETEIRPLTFSFTGKASEYFGIWIVNLLLSIVTLGIYTAWAKVRRLRYFYGNTWLDGHNFEYHARPVQILIGRIIVFGVLIALNGLVNLHPLFFVLFIPYLIALPWAINKSLAFSARMTSYRNIRFNFAGNYWSAAGIFVGMPVLAAMSGGLLAPIASQMSSNYLGRNTGYGSAKFFTDAPVPALYANLGVTILFVLLASLILGGIGFAVGGGIAGMVSLFAEANDEIEPEKFFTAVIIVAIIIGIYASFFLAYFFYAAGVRNIAYNSSQLDGKHRLGSSLGRRRYVWILVSNLFVSIFTLLMMRPWAAIRTWRYLAANTKIAVAGTFDSIVETAAPQGNVAAAEFFDIEGIDFGL